MLLILIIFHTIYLIQTIDQKILKRNHFNPLLKNDSYIRNRRTNFPCGQSFIPCDSSDLANRNLVAIAFGSANFQVKDQSNKKNVKFLLFRGF